MSHFCSNCGAKLEDDEMFCGFCGADQREGIPNTGYTPAPNAGYAGGQGSAGSQGYAGYAQNAGTTTVKRGKGKMIMLLLILAAAVVVTVIVLIMVFAGGKGVPRNPRDRFIYYMGEFPEVMSEEARDLGSEVFASILFPLNTEDASDTNTTKAKTELDLGDLTKQEITFTQESAYDKSTGDTSYEFSYSAGENALGSGGIYFTGNELLIRPIDADKPMIRYELDDEQVEGLKGTSATERFALVLRGEKTADGKDWAIAAQDFFDEYLPDVTEEDIYVDTDKGELLGDYVDWEALTIAITGKDAVKVLEGFIGVYGPMMGIGGDTLPDITKGLSDKEKKKAELEVSICAYQNIPAALWVAADLGEGKELELKLICYREGEEKEVSIEASANGADLLAFRDSVLADGEEYTYESLIGYQGKTLSVKKEGEVYSDKVDLSGKYALEGSGQFEGKTKTTGDFTKDEKVTERKNTFSVLGIEGSINTKVEETLGDAKIDPPKFVKKSGVDTGGKLKKLKKELGDDLPDVLYDTDVKALHTLAVISVLSGKGVSSAGSLSGLGGML